jgi:hypothetical protein
MLALTLLAGCGGGGGGGVSLGRLTISAEFADPTRVVPGYADSLRVVVAPPDGVTLPNGFTNPVFLSRTTTSVVVNGLEPSAMPYLLEMQALTGGEIVGRATRSVVVGPDTDEEVDVSANLESEIASIEVEGPVQLSVGDQGQFTAFAKDSAGQTLFSGAGFAWVSQDPLVLSIDGLSGVATPLSAGPATVSATLIGTAHTDESDVTVSSGVAIVTVSPKATVLRTGDQAQFTAEVAGVVNTDVDWSVDEPGGGSISVDGLYTAPFAPGTFTVRATSASDPSAQSTAIVVVQDAVACSVVNLHPLGAFASEARGIDGATQIGVTYFFTGVGHAGTWSGSAASWNDMHVAPASASFAWDGAGSAQVGSATIDGIDHASLWSGTAGSWIDLHPASATDHSFAFGTDGTQQVGSASIDGANHASLWNGTAASWIDLHPLGAEESYARAAHNGTQVGYTRNGVYHAALWNGTAASHVSLRPEEQGELGSFALAIHDGQQVGYAALTGLGGTSSLHACLWTGTAASWSDLHPAGAEHSVLRGVHSSVQVGYTIVGEKRRAGMWSGTIFSWVDLHAYLPSRFVESHAESVWRDGGTSYVVGWGRDKTTGRTEAMMWVVGP